MRASITCLIFACLAAASFVSAQGIGISPDKLVLQPSQKRTVWLLNPEPYEIAVSMKSGCRDIIVPDILTIEPRGSLATHVQSLPKTSGCNSTLVIQLLAKNTTGLDLMPSVEIPIFLSSNMYQVYKAIPSWDSKPKNGYLVTISIVGLGLLFYFAFASRVTRKPSHFVNMFSSFQSHFQYRRKPR